MAELDAGAEPARPAGRRWKLWHLSAIVAGSAAVLTLERYSPGTLPSVGYVVVLLGPLFLTTFDWSKLFRRFLRLCRVPRRSLRALLIKAALFSIFLVALHRWMVVMTALFKLWWRE